jgi:hypothetical protein
MDIALRWLVDFLSHEITEVSDLLRIVRILTLLALSWDGLRYEICPAHCCVESLTIIGKGC